MTTDKAAPTKMSKSFKTLQFAVVGATGSVGRTILSILEEYGVPAANVSAVASSRSQDISASYGEHTSLPVRVLERFDFSQTDIAFFAVGSEVAALYAPKAAAAGAIVIDKSSHFRLDPDVPLVVPEVNAHTLPLAANRRIIANPNCSTIQLVAALAPIHNLNPIKRIVTATYQAVSGAGSEALDVLFNQTKSVLMNQPSSTNNVFTKPIAFNVIPQIDDFTADGDTKEELKLRYETKKILSPDIEVSATCVRVPVFIGHSMAVHVELNNPVDLDGIKKALQGKNGLKVSAKPDDFYTPVETAQEDPVFISRLRLDPSVENGIILWVVADNLRKGAALNGVQIAKAICKHYPELLRQ
jgi:aspartate-semialdehyde dehydrogenase